jgi:phage repressor protein C with HTH and peptisase S24 domain
VILKAFFKREIRTMEIISAQHPDEDVLEKFLVAKLLPTKALQVEEHLLVCSFCQETAEELESIITGIQLAYHQSKVLPFRTHLPLYSLEAAAGKFGKQMDVEPEGWVEVPPFHVPLAPDMFVIHVKGISMEPNITDGSLCAFRGNVVAPYEDKVVLMEQYGEPGGSRYTVKLYHSSKNLDPHKEGDEAWLHERITLESTNPDFNSWDVASAVKVNVIGEFVFSM